jgi:hypothetical protein
MLHKLAMVPSKPSSGFQFHFFFSKPPSPLPTINLSHVNVETLNTSPNSDPPKTLSKGKHKASDIVVFEVDYKNLAKQGECSESKKKK